jgi:hypothetical protein
MDRMEYHICYTYFYKVSQIKIRLTYNKTKVHLFLGGGVSYYGSGAVNTGSLSLPKQNRCGYGVLDKKKIW